MKSKKLLLLVLSLILAVCIVMTAVACDNDNTADPNADVKAMLDDINEQLQTLSSLAAGNATSAQITDSYNEIIAKLQALDTLSTTDAVQSNSEALAAQITSLQNQIKALDLGLDENSNDALAIYLNTIYAKLNEINKNLADAIGAPVLFEYSEECYEKLQYIDSALRDRDCITGTEFQFAKNWITWTLMQAGYDASEIKYQDVTITRGAGYKEVTFDRRGMMQTAITADSFTTDEKFYKKAETGNSYVECEKSEATHIKMTSSTSSNIILKKQGNSDKQIIVGAHYDGDGTGDNGSGVSLALTTAEKIKNIETEYTIVFVWFTAEEYGCHGSNAYADAMTEEEVANTLYMINLDSLVCGDYTYLYGGLQTKTKTETGELDKDGKPIVNVTYTITQTEAYENALAVAAELGLEFKANPWSETNIPPEDGLQYVTPTTGDWSDHKGFKKRGIQYVYFEATNWEIPDYTGYGETYLVGMLMNTSRDYLAYIEKYFPGRPQEHLKKFSALLYALVTQENVNF